MSQKTLELNILANPVNPIFARHETFHPRWGWLKKGFDAANLDSSIFLAIDAPVKLGVGKNMVRAIRYWCNAFKITKDDDTPSEFGRNLLGENGWDEYLENPASLWLLHWNLLKPTCTAAAWYYVFNRFNRVEFSRENIFQGLKEYQYHDEINKTVAESSLNKDLSCILRMYVQSEDKQGNILEDSIDCPFVDLGLIYQVRSSSNYRFRVGAKTDLPSEIIVATCLEYASWIRESEKTISISRLLYDVSSPGVVFKLSENALYEAIEIVTKKYKSIVLSDSAGLIQLSFPEQPEKLALEIINNYYKVS